MDQNLRRGDFAEQLGVYLLRPFSAIAPVLRPDDHGIDAIATLLRAESGRRLAPEDSFYVQFKASSVTDLTFRKDRLVWLTQLQLPLFVGSVDIRSVTISLYTAHDLSRLMANLDITSACAVRLVLGGNRTNGRFETPEGKVYEVRLGPPILQWNAQRAAEADFVQEAYSIMKPVLRCERSNISLRAIKYFEQMKWSTNKVPVSGGHLMLSSVFPDKGIIPDLVAMKPYVEKLAMTVLTGFQCNPNVQDVHMVMQLVRMYEHYEVPLPRSDILRALARECLDKQVDRSQVSAPADSKDENGPE